MAPSPIQPPDREVQDRGEGAPAQVGQHQDACRQGMPPKYDGRGRNGGEQGNDCSATIILPLERQLEFPSKNQRRGPPLL